MAAARRGSSGRGQRVVEQSGIFGERGREALGRGFAPFLHELRQRLEPPRVFDRVLRRLGRPGDGGQDRGAMQGEAVAQRSGGPKGAQRGKRARDFARQRLGRLPVGLADTADRRMGVNCPRRRGAPRRTSDRDRRGTSAGWRERWRAPARGPRVRRRPGRGRSAPPGERGGRETSAAKTRSRRQG